MSLTQSVPECSAAAAPAVAGEGGAAVLHVVIVEVAAAAVTLEAVVSRPRPRPRLLPVQLQRLRRVTCDMRQCQACEQISFFFWQNNSTLYLTFSWKINCSNKKCDMLNFESKEVSSMLALITIFPVVPGMLRVCDIKRVSLDVRG